MQPSGTTGAAPPRPGGLPSGRVVDLSLLVAEELPAFWSSHMPYQQKTFSFFADRPSNTTPLFNRVGPYQTRWLVIDEHTGTHVDAPAHFIPEPDSGLPDAAPIGTVTVEQIELSQLMGPAVVLDVADLPATEPGVSPVIGPEAVTDWEAEHGPIEAGDVVLLRSGWDAKYQPGADGSAYCHDVIITRSSPGWPAPGTAFLELMIDRGVRCIGTDGVSMGSAHDGAPVHLVGLGAGIAFVEALTGLAALPVRGAYFCFAPVKIARGTGAPGRALAWLPADSVGSA